MDIETLFRGTFGIKKDKDLIQLIEASVNVAALVVPDKLRKHRSRIMKLLFDKDPANPNDDLFSDDELEFDEDDDPRAKLANNDDFKITLALPSKKKFKKDVNVQESSRKSSRTLEKVFDHQDNSEKYKFEATKRMLKQRYEEEAEKKAKRKIECMDFYESKKLCGGDIVRQRIDSRMKRMKTGHSNPKYNLHY